MRCLLTLKSLPEFLSAVLAQSDGLVTAGRLDVILTEHVSCLVSVLSVSLKSCIHVFNFLVDQTELQVDSCDLRMVLSNASLEDGETAVQVLEALAKVSTVVVVHRQGRVAVADIGMVNTQKTFLKDDGFRLKLDRLQEVAEFKLDTCDVGDAVSNVLVHGASDLKQHVDGLGPELESTVKLVLLLCNVGLGEAGTHIRVLVLDLLDVSEELADVTRLEWHVLVVSEHVLLGESYKGGSLLALVLLLGVGLVLECFVKVGNNGLNLVAKEVLLVLVNQELHSEHLAQVAHQSCLVVDSLKATEFLLLAWKLVTELNESNFLNLLIDLTGSNAHKRGR